MSGVVNVRQDRVLARRKGALARLNKRIGILVHLVDNRLEGDKEALQKKLQQAREEQAILITRTEAGYVKPKQVSTKPRRERPVRETKGNYK